MIDHCHLGDCRAILPTIEPKSVQCVVTSPPYWGLRDYGVEGQLGLEATPEEYVANMVEVFRLVREVLADDGTLWLNLGDSYHNGDKGGYAKDRVTSTDSMQRSNLGANFIGAPNRNPHPLLKPKDLVGIPWRVAFALQADGWYLRSDIIWHKPNPMPESVTDRPTKSHEYLFLLSKNERYYYDAEAIAEPGTGRAPGNTGPHKYAAAYESSEGNHYRTAAGLEILREGYQSRNKRTVWTIATQPFSGAHFATFPEALVEPCVLAGSRVGDTVLDPFMGSGTVAQVAQNLGRHWLGCELSDDYVKLQAKRTEQLGLELS